MNRWIRKLRTVPGQLAFLGMVFLGASALGLVIVCLRGSVFERYSRENYPALDGYAEEAGRILADPGSSNEKVNEVGKQLAERIGSGTLNPPQSNTRTKDLEELYGAWIRDEAFDPRGSLARRLTRLRPDWVFQRLRTTLVAGSQLQQARALTWLRIVAEEKENAARVDELVRYAHRKAERCGDRSILELSEAILALGSPRDGIP